MSSSIPESTVDLTPSNASPLERELAALSERIDLIKPEVIENIWNAWSCPAALLPWLAWALSVDHWDDGWAETVKRQAVADSPGYHRRKGTVAAILDILALAGRPATLTEWYERQPQGRRGTSTVHVDGNLDAVAQITSLIRPLLMASKPKSRSVFLGVGPVLETPFIIGAGLLLEETVTINPYSYTGEATNGTAYLGLGLLEETLTTIGAAG